MAFHPLSGIRVVDLTSSLAGPACTQLLAGLGAEVTKIERPDGDESRAWGPSMFFAVNAGKRSVVLDLKSDDGRAELLRLCDGSDVFVASLRPGAAERLRVGPRDVPTRVYCRIDAYGPGPLGEEPGYDPLMQAFAGLLSVTGEPDAPTVRVGVSLVDYATAWWAAIGILAALRDGERHVVEVSLLETALALAGYHVADALAGDEPGRHGSAFPHIAPYQVFATKDGEVMLAAANDRHYGELARRLELPEEERFATNASRVAHREALAALIEERLQREPTALWLDRLSGIPIAPVQTIREAAEHPHTRALGIVQELAGRKRLAEPLRIDGERVHVDTPPPELGQPAR